MRRLVVLCLMALVVLAPAPDPDGAPENPFMGVWEGLVLEPGFAPYRLTLEFFPGYATTAYQFFDCGGVLSFIERHPRAIVYQEHLTYGGPGDGDRCADMGRVRIEQAGNGSLLFLWFRPGGGSGAIARLRRKE